MLPTRDRNILLVYAAILIVSVGYGISLSITVLLLHNRGLDSKIGPLAAWFALGIILLSLPMGALIRRFSAKTILTLSLVGYSVCVTVFPFLDSVYAIGAARFWDGAFCVGAWVSAETILLMRADRAHKAQVMSIYAVAVAIGYIVGPFVARVIVAMSSMPVAFIGAGGLAVVSALLVALKYDSSLPVVASPEDVDPVEAGVNGVREDKPLPWSSLMWRIKTSCFGTFAYGYFQASVVPFLPLFLMKSKDVAEPKTILVPAFFAAGMLLFSNIAGRLGDRFGHLRLMRVLGIVGTLMVGAFAWLNSWPLMCVAIFIAGATLATISPVSLALQGVIVKPGDYARANSVYNSVYALGMLLGPLVSGAIYWSFGGFAMLGHLALLWAVFVLLTVIFFRDDPAARRGRDLAPQLEPNLT